MTLHQSAKGELSLSVVVKCTKILVMKGIDRLTLFKVQTWNQNVNTRYTDTVIITKYHEIACRCLSIKCNNFFTHVYFFEKKIRQQFFFLYNQATILPTAQEMKKHLRELKWKVNFPLNP